MFRPLIALGLIATAGPVGAAVTVADVSTLWTPFPGNFDFVSDQQTGLAPNDIVGNAANPGFFSVFDYGDPNSDTDGSFGARVRFASPGNGNSYSGFIWIGFDANSDNNLDGFLAVNRQGAVNSYALEIRAPGDNVNTSPSTTSVSNTSYYSEALTASNFNYRAVTVADSVDPLATLDVGSNGDVDYYLSFIMPFQEMVNFLLTRGIAVNHATPFGFVLATSTQSNSFNQDLGGVDGSLTSDLPWSEIGAITPANPIPEPTTALVALLGAGAACLRRRRHGIVG